MLNLSLNELELIPKSKGIRGCKSMSKERLLSALNESESAKSEKNLNNGKIKKIREEFNKLRDRFSKLKIKEIRKIFYEIENKKEPFCIKNKRD